VSPRQYTMLGEFIKHGASIEDIAHLKQNTLGSLIYRKWVRQKHQSFDITAEGRAAYYRYGTEDILRKSFHAALSRYVRGGAV